MNVHSLNLKAFAIDELRARVSLVLFVCHYHWLVFETVMILNVSRLVFSPAPPNFQEMPV